MLKTLSNLQIANFAPKIYYQVQNEGRDNLIEATNDVEALNAWLAQYQKSKNTYKVYMREAKRFLLWASFIKGKYIKELKVGDIEDYIDFLKEPPVAWVASKSELTIGGNLWRPFCETGLKGNSFLTAIRAIKSLFSFLHSASYISANPLSLIKNIYQKTMDVEIAKIDVKKRMLNDAEWQAFLKALDDLDESTVERCDIKHRSKLIVGMLYYLGLRIFELEKSFWSSFYFEDKAWWFFIKGKGGKLSKVPVNDNLLSLVSYYREYMSLGLLPKDMSDDAPILMFKNKMLSKRTMYKYIKEIALIASKSFKAGSISNEKLKNMSPHWLRHLSASHQDKLGVPATIIKENHRHGSFLTTQIYLHGEDNVRHSEIQKLDANINTDGVMPDLKRVKVAISNAYGKEGRAAKFFNNIESYILKNGKVVEKHDDAISPYRVYEVKEIDTVSIKEEAEFRLLEANIDDI